VAVGRDEALAMAVLLEATLPGVPSTMATRLEHSLNHGIERHGPLGQDLIALLVKPEWDGLRLAVLWRSDDAARRFQERVLLPRLTTLGLDAPDDVGLTPVRIV
jgi:hypothetical protein